MPEERKHLEGRLVAARLIDNPDAVGVPIRCNADICAVVAHRLCQRLEVVFDRLGLCHPRERGVHLTPNLYNFDIAVLEYLLDDARA